jgi:hypothetical protein
MSGTRHAYRILMGSRFESGHVEDLGGDERIKKSKIKSKAVPLYAMEALRGRGDIAPTYSRPRQ